MTQAIALKQALDPAGHDVCGVAVGMSHAREIPSFFRDTFDCPFQTIASPSFVFKNNRGISMTATSWNTMTHFGDYLSSVKKLKKWCDELQPDLVINFYEPIAGLMNRFHKDTPPSIAVGHQYMLEHPQYIQAERMAMQRMGMIFWNRMVGHRSVRAALSFYEVSDMPEKETYVVPPLLRQQLFDIDQPTNENFLLIYLVNHGYAKEIQEWHQDNQDVGIHCFYDKPDAPEEETVQGNPTFHRLHGEKFLALMAKCRGVVCTAGFESVCEAAWLKKPLLMVPVENHVEQDMNATDAVKAGFGTKSLSFDLSRFKEVTDTKPHEIFQKWTSSAETKFLDLIERTGRATVTQVATV